MGGMRKGLLSALRPAWRREVMEWIESGRAVIFEDQDGVEGVQVNHSDDRCVTILGATEDGRLRIVQRLSAADAPVRTPSAETSE